MLGISIVKIENIMVAKHIAIYFLKKQPNFKLVHFL